MNIENKKELDYDAGYFAGRDFGRRSTPRLPTRFEVEQMTGAWLRPRFDSALDVFQEDYEEAWETLTESYIAIFERYRDSSGNSYKLGLVAYEDGSFDCYKWLGGNCTIEVKK